MYVSLTLYLAQLLRRTEDGQKIFADVLGFFEPICVGLLDGVSLLLDQALRIISTLS